MRRKKKKWKEEVKRRKGDKSKGGDDAERDATLWVIEEEELDEVWNLVKKQEMYKKAVELKHTAGKEAKKENINEAVEKAGSRVHKLIFKVFFVSPKSKRSGPR